MDSRSATVAALAGRRIDAPNTKEPRFPLVIIPEVRKLLLALLRREKIRLLICSAACGADLIALDAALKLGIRCRVVLPFEPDKFRRISVVDRPGDWGSLFDHAISVVKSNGDLQVLPDSGDDTLGYQLANRAIVEEACSESKGRNAIAIVVWEGRSRGEADATAAFRRLARAAGMTERIVFTKKR